MSARSHRWRCAAWGLALLGSTSPACNTTHKDVQGPPPGAPQLLPVELRLRAADRITAADFVITAHGELLAAWVETLISRETSTSRVRTARTVKGRWEPPRVLATTGTRLSLATTSGVTHLVLEPGTRHFTTRDDGATWQEQAPFTPPSGCRVRGFGVSPAGADLLVVQLCDLEDDTGPFRRVLLVSHVSDGPPAPPTRLAAWDPSPFPPAPPRLLVRAGHVWLLVGRNARRVSDRGVSVAGELLLFTSEDAGRSWSAPSRLPVDARLRTGQRTGAIDSVAMASLGQRTYAFYSCNGIYATSSKDGADWSEPWPLTDYETSFSHGTRESADVSAVPFAAGLAVGWIDARNRLRRHQGPNPLGGFPWSDDASHALNNDVFVALAPRDSDIQGRHWELRRLSAAASFAHSLRLRARPDAVLAAWAGRPHVGKKLASFASPPQLYLSPIPHP